MDPNTNIPTDPSEPLPLGPPLHPADTVTEPEPQVGPVVFQPTTPAEPSPPPQVYTPNVPPLPPPSPIPPPPPGLQPPQPGPGNIFTPAQNPPMPPLPPLPGAPAVNPAFNPQPVFNPQAVTPTAPGAPVVVSGGFAPDGAMPPMPGYPSPVGQEAGAPPPPPASGQGHRFKRLLVVLTGLVVLASGSAAAYYGLVVPNQPANVLKTAIVNTLKQNSVNYKATVDYQPNSGATIAPLRLTVSGSRNAAAKTSDTVITFNGYGTDLSLEARFVNNNLYVKVGDLSTLAALAGQYVPSLANTATTISKDLSNQWIVVDQTLLDQGGIGCVINSSFSISQADINLLSSDYAKHPFLNIKNTSSASVNGQAAEEFQVNIADNTAAGFIQNIGNLSAIKHLETCKGVTNTNTSSSLASIKGDTSTTALNIWVSKSNKQIVQMSLPDTAKYMSSVQGKVNNLLTLNYTNASITAPANAESVLALYTKLAPALQSALGASGLNISNLFSGLGGGTTNGGVHL